VFRERYGQTFRVGLSFNKDRTIVNVQNCNSYIQTDAFSCFVQTSSHYGCGENML
jgi:hypothetical protein